MSSLHWNKIKTRCVINAVGALPPRRGSVLSVIAYSSVITVCTSGCNINKAASHTVCSRVCMIFTVNNICFPKQLVCLYNRSGVCSLCARSWNFICKCKERQRLSLRCHLRCNVTSQKWKPQNSPKIATWHVVELCYSSYSVGCSHFISTPPIAMLLKGFHKPQITTESR